MVYRSPIVRMRQLFDLDISIRPCQSFPNNPLNFIRRKGDGFEEPKVDVVIFRQNTECLYSGVEWTNPPKQVRDALETHPAMKIFAKVPGEDLAVSCRIMTRGAVTGSARLPSTMRRNMATSPSRSARSPMSSARPRA